MSDGERCVENGSGGQNKQMIKIKIGLNRFYLVHHIPARRYNNFRIK
jgi:hypothetical protein